MFRAHYVGITARCITRVYPLKLATEVVINQSYTDKLENYNILEEQINADIILNIEHLIKKTLSRYNCRTCIAEIFEIPDDFMKRSCKADFMETLQHIYNIT